MARTALTTSRTSSPSSTTRTRTPRRSGASAMRDVVWVGSPIGAGAAGGSCAGSSDGQRHREGRAPALAFAARVDRPPVQLHEMTRHGQAEPEPAVAAGVRRISLAEALEDVGEEVPAKCLRRCLRPPGGRRVGASRSTRTVMRPARGVNLIALETRFHTICRRRSGSPATSPRRGRARSGGGGSSRVAAGIKRLDGGGDDGRQLQGADVQAELRAHDPGEVEDVGDDLGLGGRVALDGLEPAGGGGLVEAAPSQQVHPAHDGGQGRPQLVGQRGEELVLDPAGRLRLLRARSASARSRSRSRSSAFAA